MARGRRLGRSFYARPTEQVAHELLGKYLVYHRAGITRVARLVEVEAYIGEEDPACHAACGLTKRNAIMYGPAGFAYVYFIYGMYHCLNVVTERQGFPAAVLLRAAEPVSGFSCAAKDAAETRAAYKALCGPGKLCRAFGLTRRQNGLDLTGHELYLEDRGNRVATVCCSVRIGVRKGADRWWRYFDGDSAAVSARRTPARQFRTDGRETAAGRHRDGRND